MCWLLLIYVWVGYPLILMGLVRLTPSSSAPQKTNETRRSVWARIVSLGCDYGTHSEKSKMEREQDSMVPFLPAVAILLSAHNEEMHIGARIKNLIELGYPEEKITVRIGVDGSSDRTADIARQSASTHLRIQVYEVTKRRGKIAMLKDLFNQSKEDILILTDANTFFKANVIQKLVSHFKDPNIGCVCGKLEFVGEGAESVYWQIETQFKIMESALDSCLGANGAIYAIRRSLFWTEIPDNTIVDDFVIGMKVREQGMRVVYEPRAVGQENLPSTTDEWVRRKRIGAGDYQALSLCKKCLLPKYGKFAWVFWSHKVLRWFTPHILITLFISAFATLAIHIFLGTANSDAIELKFSFTPLIVMVVLLSALSARLLTHFPTVKGKFLKPLRLCDHFLTMQAALFLGFLRFCRGNLQGHWERTSRD
jgi:cellulose synthase/poly-beta-1,6-N-acetylglucosamine synthase-like glycosyltransferase